MSLLKKILTFTREPKAAEPLSPVDAVLLPGTAESSEQVSAAKTPRVDDQDEPIDANALDDIVRVEETRSAEFWAGDLFRRRFGGEPPDYPRHFVAFYRAGRKTYRPIGYIHYTTFEDCFLCGGMVVDDRAYRRIPAHHRALIKGAGGIAEIMLRQTFAMLAHAPAIWGYVGDKQAEQVDIRVGFRHTGHPHVMVVWNRDIPEAEKAERLARVVALGPF